MPRREPRRVGVPRRTVLWTTPVVLSTVAAPAFAASTCSAPTMGYDATWIKGGSPASYVADGSNGLTTHWDSTQRFWAWADNPGAAGAANYVLTFTKVLILAKGQTYTFAVDVASDYGGDNTANSSEAQLTFTIGGVTKYAGSTKGTSTGLSSLNTPRTGQGRTTVAFTHQPAASGTFTFIVQITVKPKGNLTYSDDIGVGTITVSC